MGEGKGMALRCSLGWDEDNQFQGIGDVFLVESQAASSTSPTTSNNNTSPSIHPCIMNINALLETASQAAIDYLAAERTDELAVTAHGHVEMLMDHIKLRGRNRHQEEILS